MSSWTSLMATAGPANPWLRLIFLFSQTNTAAASDHDGFVVKGVVEVGQARVGASGRLIDLCRTFHLEGVVGTLAIEDLDELVESSLLLKEVRCSGFGGCHLEGEVHPLMATVLLGRTYSCLMQTNSAASCVRGGTMDTRDAADNPASPSPYRAPCAPTPVPPLRDLPERAGRHSSGRFPKA